MSETKPGATYIEIDAGGQPLLRGSRCTHCEAVFVGLRDHCGRCGARKSMEAVTLSTRGRLHSYTIVYRSYPGIKVPFVSAIVDLEGGGTVKGNLLDIEPTPEAIRFGMPVRVEYRDAGTMNSEASGYLVHVFVPEREAA